MRILHDVTQTHGARHGSGLVRVSRRLRAALAARPGLEVVPVAWDAARGTYVRPGTRTSMAAIPGDRLLVTEPFSEPERPGFGDHLARTPAATVAMFHDAIPLRFPEFTWPRSVARHPHYLKSLAGFDRVLAISRASRDDLVGYWRWLAVGAPPRVDVVTHGADFLPRRGSPTPAGDGAPLVLCTGILEPRKGQSLLLDAAERHWRAGRRFDLVLVGRANPHFGRPIVERVRRLASRGRGVSHRAEAADGDLAVLYRRATVTVFPSRAEGFGLPVLESLWMGVPCIASDAAPAAEVAAGPGVEVFPSGDLEALVERLGRALDRDAGERERLRAEILARPLPTWADTAREVAASLEDLRVSRPCAS